MEKFVERSLIVLYVTNILIIISFICLIGLLKFSVIPFRFYAALLKPVVLVFWSLIILALILIKPYLEQITVEEERSLRTAGSANRILLYLKYIFRYVTGSTDQSLIRNLISAPISIVISLVIVFESFLLLKIVIFMWIAIIVLAFFTLLGETLPENKRIKRHMGFMQVLSTIVIVFTIIPLSGFFEKSFLDGAGFIDKVVFSNLAALKGDNYKDLLKRKIIKIHDNTGNPAAIGTYIDTLNIYVERCKNGYLDKSNRPHEVMAEKQTVHSIFIKSAFKYLDDVNSAPYDKTIIENLLDYLICISGPLNNGDIFVVNINEMDHNYPLGPAFLNRFLQLLSRKGFMNDKEVIGKLVSLHSRLCEHTEINISSLETYLKKEVTPCQRKY